MAASSLVIKVKFGETLRRLTTPVDGNALSNIVVLKEKIRRLLSFGSNVMFAMTYLDEDGDMVILATEDDLRDIIRQSLSPLRITVNLCNGTPFGSCLGTTLAPMTSTPFHLQFQQSQNQFQQLQLQRQLLRQQQQQLHQQHLQQQTLHQQQHLQQQQEKNESGSSDSESLDGSLNSY